MDKIINKVSDNRDKFF